MAVHEWQDIRLARQGTATEPAVAAIIAFALHVLSSPADVTDADVEVLRGQGYSDEQIAEVVGLVPLQLLTSAFNLVAGIER